MIDGILILDKPKGMTSAALVSKIKKKFHLKKVGHGGTLDPIATGLLPICVNRATKMAFSFLESDKVYEGVFILGIETDTHDIAGKVITTQTMDVSSEDIQKAMKEYVGEIQQLPPMFSALKKDGKPLYVYARQNQEVSRPLRTITIFDFAFLGRQSNEISFRIHCSKGTYVRTLCHDLGKKLGTSACLKELTRVKVGKLHLSDSIKLEQLTEINLTQTPHWKSIEFLRA